MSTYLKSLKKKKNPFFQVVDCCGFRLEKQNLRLLHGSVQGCGNSLEGVSRDEANLRHTLPLVFFYKKSPCCFFLSILDLKKNLSHIM